MKIGMIGLGRMGAGMAQRLMRKGHECVVYDAKSAAVTNLKEDGATVLRRCRKWSRKWQGHAPFG